MRYYKIENCNYQTRVTKYDRCENYYYYSYYFLQVFHTSLSESKFLQVFTILISIFSLDGLYSSFNIQFLQFPFEALGCRPKRASYNLFPCHSHVPQFCQFSAKVQEFVDLFARFYFHSVVRQNGKIHQFFFLVNQSCDRFISQNFIKFMHTIF